MNDIHQRYRQQRDLVPLGRCQATRITVIGVGAIGRQVALQLAAAGARQLQLIDFDRVDPTNLVSQGYLFADLGETKVAATARQLRALNAEIEVQTIVDRYRSRYAPGEVIFTCVDSIAARAAIWRSVGQQVQLWLDGRMLGEVIRVLAATHEQGQTSYAASLFAAEEAQAGPCTAHSTLYAASIAAGLMVHQFSRWLRDLPLDFDTSINLLAGEWIVAAGNCA